MYIGYLIVQGHYIHTKPELSLSDLFSPRLNKYLRKHETTKPT